MRFENFPCECKKRTQKTKLVNRQKNNLFFSASKDRTLCFLYLFFHSAEKKTDKNTLSEANLHLETISLKIKKIVEIFFESR